MHKSQSYFSKKVFDDDDDDDDEKMFIYNSNYRTYCIFITNKS